ncbi:MAG: M50 family metallopeptidase [Hyphomicrobiales bacterium]
MLLANFFKFHWQMILITAGIIACWDFAFVFPVKILVIFLHEFAHGVAVILTGGTWENLSLNVNQGGHVLFRGGNRFVIASAGYLGSLFFGVVLFVAAVRTNFDRYVLGFLGAVMILVAAIYSREMFPLLFCILFGVAMIVIAWFAHSLVSDLLLRIFGLVSMIYVPYDIFSDTIQRSHVRSDARVIAEEIGGATVFWGGLWLLISVVVILVTIKFCLSDESNLFSIRKNNPPVI